MLLRLLFLFLIAYILISVVKAYLLTRAKSSTDGSSDSRGRKSEEEMVLDPQCQIYVPKSEAFLQNGKYFCSQECARLFLSR